MRQTKPGPHRVNRYLIHGSMLVGRFLPKRGVQFKRDVGQP